jgi:hypothetical protein
MILTFWCYKKHIKPLDCMAQNGTGVEFQNENERESEREPETERERETPL